MCMRSWKPIVSLSLFLALVCALPGLAAAQAPAQRCAVLLGTGKAQANSPESARGAAWFALAGVRYSATLDLTFAFGAPNADGACSVASTHLFTVRNAAGRKVGTIGTADTGTLTPSAAPGLLSLDLSMVVVSGTGRFRHLSGSITDRGFLNVSAAAPASASALAGKLCDAGRRD